MARSPFFRTREVTFSCQQDSWTRRSKTIQRLYAYELMEMPRLKHYVDLMRDFGFNSIQFSELWENYESSGWQISPRAFRVKLGAVADYARANGMKTSLFVWGAGPVDALANRGRGDDWLKWESLCPCVPGAMPKLRRYYRRQAALAPHFDHVITHWADPGGCQGGKCTITDAMHLHNEILAGFRRKNPKIMSTFSIWLLAHRGVPGMPNWPGYGSASDVLDAGLLPKDVGIAQGGRFKLDEAKVIAKTKRRLGVWAWYLADMEIFPSLHVHTNIMKEYFANLPRETSRLADWHTIESNCHILNLPSLYVGAQLLKDPYSDPDKHLEDFCEFAFGKVTGPAMADGLKAVAATRCQSDYLRIAPSLAGEPLCDLPDEKERPRTHFKVATRAVEALKRIRPEKGFKSPLEPLTDAVFYIKALRAHLERIAQYAEFRARLAEQKRNKRRPDARRLPAVAGPGKYMTQFEYRLYREHLSKL